MIIKCDLTKKCKNFKSNLCEICTNNQIKKEYDFFISKDANKDEAMEVIYVKETYVTLGDEEVTVEIATCPTCEQYPLYDMNPCPYCGQKLKYRDEEGGETK